MTAGCWGLRCMSLLPFYDRVVKSFVDASGPLEAGGTFSGSGCITSQREFSAAGQSRAP